MAPEPIPLSYFASAADILPGALRERVRDRLSLADVAWALGHYAIARVDLEGLQLHRLTQSIVRDSIPPEDSVEIRRLVENILTVNRPGDPRDPDAWPDWSRLLPHLLASDPAGSSNIQLQNLACDACEFLLRRGDLATGGELTRHFHFGWSKLGPDIPVVLRAQHLLGCAAYDLGNYEEAARIHADTRARRRATLGPDNHDTLQSANNLAIDLRGLGDIDKAKEVDHDTLTRRRRVLGESHLDTLRSLNNLGVDFYLLGEFDSAFELHSRAYSQRIELLGPDHPDTLHSANDLARDLRSKGDLEAARNLHEDTWLRRKRILGDNHHDTLRSANEVALDLHQLGRFAEARALDEDTLDRRRTVFGPGHPDSVASSINLNRDIEAMGWSGPLD
jgi:tetratricopeptide (TPR) repeat protein